MLKPRALRPGDRIAVVSPASPFARDEFDRGVDELRGQGFEPVWDESVFARTGYVSGPPEMRASAFLEAWRDPSVAALVDRKSTRLNSSHSQISYAVFCLKKKKKKDSTRQAVTARTQHN